MFDRIAPRYEFVNRVMTFGMDAGWRRATVAALQLDRGAVVLDVACGTGDFCRELASADYRPIGFDLSFGMLAAATVRASLVQADALRLPVADSSADGLTCGFALRNVTDLDSLFAEAARTLRPGGRVGLLEVGQPDGRALRWGHSIYFQRVVPVIGGLLSDRDAYRYLPESTAYLPPPEGLLNKLIDAGFQDVNRRSLGMGAVQIVTGTRS
jgi:demethylmenaquinone methyltransferase / 2-methoxy-6-polyprenyl-1,4-benzoquinol methylase